MDQIGLRQLLERFNEIKVRLGVLKGKHDLRTYLELAKVSRDLNQPGVFNYASTEELSKTIMAELEEHKTGSIIGITKYIDNITDRIQERVLDGKRFDRLKTYFDLLVQHAIPNSYGQQSYEYSDNLDEILHSGADMHNAYSEAAA